MRDLSAKIPNAPNFTYGEVVKSDTAKRLGIVNKPTEEDWQRAEKFAATVLQPIRNRFGRIRVTSWFRSPTLCRAIGSNDRSNHTRGDTADIEPIEAGVSLFDVFQFIHQNLPYHELIAEYFPDGWVHVCTRSTDNKYTIKLKDPEHNFERLTFEKVKEVYG